MVSLLLEGCPYEVGFQHGDKLSCLIQCAIRKHCRFLGDNRGPSQAAVRERGRRLEAEFPELMQEIRGIADGAECSLDDLLTYNLRPITGGCSNLVFLSAGEPMLGHVNDDVHGSFDVAFHVRRPGGSELLHIGSAGSAGTALAMNSDGLAVSHAAARSGGLLNTEAALNLALFRRALAERTRDCDEARSFLTRHSFVSGADNVVCIDKTGEAFVAEKLPTTVEFRRPDEGGMYCTGRALTPRIGQIVHQEAYERGDPNTETLVKREQYFEAVIAGNLDGLSVELMKQALRCTDQGIEVCNELSNWAAILLPSRFEMWVADRFPCHNEFERFAAA